VLAVLLMVSIGASAETLTGTVVGVADGDTITVLDANREQHKIRVAGIDAPEKAHPVGHREISGRRKVGLGARDCITTAD